MFDPGTIATIAGILGLSIKDLVSALTKAWSRHTDEERKIIAAARIDAGLQIIHKGLLEKLLLDYYSYDLSRETDLATYSFRVDETEVDTTVVTKSSWINLNVPLGGERESCELVEKDVPHVPKIGLDKTAEILASIQERGIQIWNDPIYRLVDIELTQDQIKASFARDEFFQYRLTIGALLDEALQALIDTEFNIERVIAEKPNSLPMRQELLPGVCELADLKTRICAGGINVLFAMARGAPYHDFAIPIQRRSRAVSDGQSRISVIPKAFHQPMIDPRAEVNLSSTVYRELYEELFGGLEAEKGPRRLRPDWFFGEFEPLKWFLNHHGAYELECTCFGLNLITGNYDFGILLAVRDESYWKEFSHLLMTNWEVLDSSEPVVSSKNSHQLSSLIQRSEWATEGLFSFVEGLKRLGVLDRKKVNLPDIEEVKP